MGQLKMDNPEKLAKHRAQHVVDTNQYTQTQTRHEQSYKQLVAKTNRTSFLFGNRNGHHSTKRRT
jgi:hypothetical protein